MASEEICPACGYTERDKEIHGDHRLCRLHKSEERTFLGELRRLLSMEHCRTVRLEYFLVNHAEEIAALVEAAKKYHAETITEHRLMLQDALNALDCKTREGG